MMKSINYRHRVFAMRMLAIVCAVSFLAAQEIPLVEEMPDTCPVYVVSHGWHTGIIMRGTDLPLSLKSAHITFPQNVYIEFGWGDRNFYQNADPGFGDVLQAAFWPDPGIMHVAGFDSSVPVYFPYSRIIRLKISRNHLISLNAFLVSYFSWDRQDKLLPLGNGLYGNSQFYESPVPYFFPKTCNVWTALAINNCGIPLSPLLYQRADKLIDDLKEYGEIIRDSVP